MSQVVGGAASLRDRLSAFGVGDAAASDERELSRATT
jgi:hypothetical protein